ncbi:uncharacterized protein LOC126972994 isoform X1 [Leptidea sinapis]|uniref:uncharacterized protein LOC126972994 isoform X1 n=1 Tax=Leptidea sinapis TaxID=189913 RepID=UPI0021299C63|nr:uncharacterized protein LOC126972994 isoform X1 [Leptidea sinapis]
MGVVGALGGWGAVLALEVGAPAALLCWLCCWPDDSNSDSSSGKHPSKPVITDESRSGARRRSDQFFGGRFGTSAVSLHLPSTSGVKVPLSAHRSHEEIRGHRKSQLEPAADETRYHSAPSVIDEVLHRRDWERSTKDLYIPLRPEQESISLTEQTNETNQSDEQIVGKTCKKHYTNIKSSRKKESDADIKDTDATEASSFYIGDSLEAKQTESNNDIVKYIHTGKQTKQSLNESIKSKDRKMLVPVEEFKVSLFVQNVEMDVDRSGAQHHSVESRSSLYNPRPPANPPPSVDAVGYDLYATYLWDGERLGAEQWSAATAHCVRGRHASAGDVLAPPAPPRPHSTALSESDLDLDLEGSDEPPPAYHELEHLSIARKETAI